jgi:hypothetical protein
MKSEHCIKLGNQVQYFQMLTEDEFKDTLDQMVMQDSNNDHNNEDISVKLPISQATSVMSTLSSSAPIVAAHTDSSLLAFASTAKTSHKKAQPAPFEFFINTVTVANGSDIQVTKKPHKIQSDKGKKRGSRAKENASPNPSSAPGN